MTCQRISGSSDPPVLTLEEARAGWFYHDRLVSQMTPEELFRMLVQVENDRRQWRAIAQHRRGER